MSEALRIGRTYQPPCALAACRKIWRNRVRLLFLQCYCCLPLFSYVFSHAVSFC